MRNPSLLLHPGKRANIVTTSLLQNKKPFQKGMTERKKKVKIIKNN